MGQWRKCAQVGCRNRAAIEDQWCVDCALKGLAPHETLSKELRGPEPATTLYDVTCLNCGRGYERRWTQQDLLDVHRFFSRRCPVCNGTMLIEPAYYGSIGSAEASRLMLSR